MVENWGAWVVGWFWLCDRAVSGREKARVAAKSLTRDGVTMGVLVVLQKRHEHSAGWLVVLSLCGDGCGSELDQLGHGEAGKGEADQQRQAGGEEPTESDAVLGFVVVLELERSPQ